MDLLILQSHKLVLFQDHNVLFLDTHGSIKKNLNFVQKKFKIIKNVQIKKEFL